MSLRVVSAAALQYILNSPSRVRRDSIIGNAVVLKTTARKGLQVRVLFSPPHFILDFRFAILDCKSFFAAIREARFRRDKYANTKYKYEDVEPHGVDRSDRFRNSNQNPHLTYLS